MSAVMFVPTAETLLDSAFGLTAYSYILYDAQNKQWLLMCTRLYLDCVCCEVGTEFLYIV